MPEIKHDFSTGKMNKDLDERIVPNGQYRDALNIQVRTTDGGGDGVGNAGSVQNIQGNKAIIESIHYEKPYNPDHPDNLPSNETTFIGSVASEKNNNAYFFAACPRIEPFIKTVAQNPELVTSQKVFIDTIVEVNTGENDSDPTTLPVVVDKWAIIDQAISVIGSSYMNFTSELDGSFDEIELTSGYTSDLRVGMVVQALDDNNFNHFNAGAEIQSINNTTNTIKFYDIQSQITNWDDISVFIFRAPRVLNFDNRHILTGINIIDDLLFWTDNHSEPKKINITRCKAGTNSYTNHTKLKLTDPNDSDIIVDFTNVNGNGIINSDSIVSSEESLTPAVNNDLKEEHITVIRKAPLMAPTVHMKQSDREGTTEVINFYHDFASVLINGEINNIALNATVTIPTQADQDNTDDTDDATVAFNNPNVFNNVDYRINDLLEFKSETFDTELFITAIIDSVNWSEGDGAGYKILSIRIISINKIIPAINDAIENSGFWKIVLSQRDPLFELKFGRFGLRYKYQDGEYSNFGPWSEIAFMPGTFDFDHKKGYNLGMTNTVRSLSIQNFIPHQRVRCADMIGVDLLYKTTTSPNVYIVKSITKGRDPEWDEYIIDENGLAFGKLDITSEMIYKTLPGNQLLRAWDNVPKYALAQEIAANRLVYGNYEQGYEIDNRPGLKQSLKNYPSAVDAPSKSMKSMRDYQVGIVFGDKYGRETPVVSPGYLSEEVEGRFQVVDGNLTIPKTFSELKNTIEIEQVWGEDMNGVPDNWISYTKYYIKETTNEYYNVVMDRWYDAQDGNVWLSFASADRNKIDDETYLILKNEHGENFAVLEKARYKVIAIENEAPDFIKQENRNMGRVTLGEFVEGGTMTNEQTEYMWAGTPDPLNVSPSILESGLEIAIEKDRWNGFLDGYTDPKGDLQIRVSARSGGTTVHGNTWRQVTYNHKVPIPEDPDAVADEFAGYASIRWDKPFHAEADMLTLLLAALNVDEITEIDYYLEFREVITTNKPEFDGKFFVKIEKDAVLLSKVLGTSAEQTSYGITQVIPIAYIDNSTYNPSDLFSVESDAMPRRAYKWFNDGNNDSLYGEEENFANGDDTESLSIVADVVTGGDAGANVATTLDYSGTWQDSLLCGNTSTQGCHPQDAEYMGLGCWTTENPDDPDLAPNVMNRAVETYRFWSWFNNFASVFVGDTGHKATVFIDGMRTRKTNKNGESGESAIYDGSASEPGETFNTNYYKQTGLDVGNLSSQGGDYDVFGPSTGELGRVVFSVTGEWDTDPDSAENQLRSAMSAKGTLFRFQKDPNKVVYKVVSSQDNGLWSFQMSNSSATAGSEWNTFYNGNQVADAASNVNFANPDFECNTPADCHNFMGWTNINPTHVDQPATDSAAVVNTGYADGVNSFVKVAGVGPSLGGNANEVPIGGDAAFACIPCKNQGYNQPGGNSGNKEDCERNGIRIEFRKFDTSNGTLVDDGTRGIDTSDWDPRGAICHDGRESMEIAILEPKSISGEVVIPTANPAIWETEPKEDVGLDIYYEASNAIPTRLTSENTPTFAPYNSIVKVMSFVNSAYQDATPVPLQDNNPGYQNYPNGFRVSHIGYTKTHSVIAVKGIVLDLDTVAFEDSLINFGISTDNYLVFVHPDGTKTMSKVVAHMEPQGEVNDTSETLFKESVTATGYYKIDSEVWKFPVELGWFNCYSFGNGVESDRIRDDFNAPTIDNGVKVSAKFLDYGKEKRGSGMIYSGIYNSTSGTNRLNEFNMAEKITKDINPSYGSIQALKTRDTDVVVLTEDKVLKVTTNKDALYNADGNPQLIASNRVLGTAVPFSGDYGISKNPESLASDQYRLYFTDMQRGAVLRLSRDGLTPISSVGMKTWFRDNLRKTKSNIGTFDSVNGEYNITMNFGENVGGSVQYLGDNKARTISFNEESKGWVSFKSFIPQAGLSVGGKYITAVSSGLSKLQPKKGIWLHNYDILESSVNSNSFGDVINRNTFYAPETALLQGTALYYHENSMMSVMFNDMPDTVKGFRAVSYEGSQAKVNQFITSNANQPDGTPFNGVSDNEYYNLNNVDGWWVSHIKTDLSYDGDVIDFKEKEGKWFQRISGKKRGPNNTDILRDQDLNEFSVQGLGQIVPPPPEPEITSINITVSNSDDNE
tara:strand:+ start:3116 stop:9532 length:6417 start_codon:yes stop_codon:yes gene_type:complete